MAPLQLSCPMLTAALVAQSSYLRDASRHRSLVPLWQRCCGMASRRGREQHAQIRWGLVPRLPVLKREAERARGIVLDIKREAGGVAQMDRVPL